MSPSRIAAGQPEPSARRIVAYTGSLFTVAYALTSKGAPGSDFFNSLKVNDQAKLFHLFKLIGEKGRIANREHFKKVEGEFFEFKSFQIRMPCYYLPGRLMIVTHGFIKKTGPIPRSELDIAERIKQEDSVLITVQGDNKPWKN